MTVARLLLAAATTLVGGALLLVAGAPAPTPPLTLVLECHFHSQGQQRTLKVYAGDAAIVVPPTGRVLLSLHLKSKRSTRWRKTGSVRHWLADWQSGPAGPGAKSVSFAAPQQGGTYRLEHVARVHYRGTGRWPALWRRRCATARARLFVLVPLPGRELANGSLRGYQVGSYPPGTDPPAQFVEITRQSASALVSPHYRLGTFASPGRAYPKYAPFHYALLDKLEAVSRALRAQGHLHGALTAYSVYRTPLRNAEVSGARLSQHMWGRAADLMVDERPRDGRMDGVNRDGKVSIQDAIVVGRIVRRLERQGKVVPGGTGVYEQRRPLGGYGANAHLDVRGRQAKWGRHYDTPGDMDHWRNIAWDG